MRLYQFVCFWFLVLVGWGAGLVEAWIFFGEGREMRMGIRWGRKWLLFQFNVSNCSAILFGSWHAAKYCPVQLWAGCSGGQPVTATSKRRNVGGILSSVAEFVETQGWESCTGIFKLQVNKDVLAFTQRWQMDPHAPRFLRQCVLFLVDLREIIILALWSPLTLM